MNHPRSLRATFAVVAAGLLLGLTACNASTTDDAVGDRDATATGHHRHQGTTGTDPTVTPTQSASPTATPTPKKHYPTGPPMLLESIAPLDHTTVGVAMPISITFSTPVATKARKGVEDAISLSTSTPVRGAWHWFGSQRLDFRPRSFWPSGTKVSMVAAFDHVADGNGRYGTHSYTRDFTIGADVRTHVYAAEHKTVVTRDGKVLRTMPSDAGSPEFPSWDGTMAVVSTAASVRMTSCSVQIACSPSDPNFYDLTLPWDVRITNSGTFLHYSTGDPYPGHSYGSHGCIHLSYDDAKWFYQLSKQGDPVTITGSPRGKAEGDNGYADYDVSWSDWLAGSGRGAFTTSALA